MKTTPRRRFLEPCIQFESNVLPRDTEYSCVIDGPNPWDLIEQAKLCESMSQTIKTMIHVTSPEPHWVIENFSR